MTAADSYGGCGTSPALLAAGLLASAMGALGCRRGGANQGDQLRSGLRAGLAQHRLDMFLDRAR